MKRFLILMTIAGAALLAPEGCNYPETLSVSESDLIFPNDSSVIYRLDKRYFLLIPGDTALFYGSKSCTVITNGARDTCFIDSLFLRTITNKTFDSTINNIRYFIYPQSYHYCNSFSDLQDGSHSPQNRIIRYFLRNDSAVLQVKYSVYSDENPKDSTIHYLPENKQKVFPRIIEVGKHGWFQSDTTAVPTTNTWHTSPLVKHPLFSYKETISFDGFSVAYKPLALPYINELPYTVSGVEYTNGIMIKTYYTLRGVIPENGRDIFINGSLSIVRTYFTDRGMIDQAMDLVIQKIFSDTVQVIKEHSYIGRGPGGAKVYPEKDYP